VGALEDVVSQYDYELSPGGEVARHSDDLSDPAGLHLHLVGEIQVEQRRVAAALGEFAVPEQIDHLAGVRLARHDQHFTQSCELEKLERVIDHRPASQREQVLIRDPRQFAESHRLAAGANQAACPGHQPEVRAFAARGVQTPGVLGQVSSCSQLVSNKVQPGAIMRLS
jgi:hypothetical protein